MKHGHHDKHGGHAGHGSHGGHGTHGGRRGHYWKDFFKRPHKTLYILAGIVVLAVAFRLFLPSMVEHYVNHELKKSKTYAGTIGHINLALWRGAYQIHDIKIFKRSGKIKEPFFSAPLLDLSVDWDALAHHKIVARIYMDQPKLNFIKGPTPQQTQAGEQTPWNEILENLTPFKLDRLDIQGGQIHYKDDYSNPKVDIYFTQLGASATNLSNARFQPGPLPAGIRAHAQTIGNGSMYFHLQFNPVAPAPDFQLQASLTNVNLPALNSFLRAYGKFDVARGTFYMFTSIAATNRAFEGYIKVLFRNLDVFEWQKEHTKSFIKIFWDAIVGTATTVLRNQPKDQLATKIPIAGVFTNSTVDLTTTIGSLLRNAFVRALMPKFDQIVTTGQVSNQVQHGQVPNANTNGTPRKGGGSNNSSTTNQNQSASTPPTSGRTNGATLLELPEKGTNTPAAPP